MIAPFDAFLAFILIVGLPLWAMRNYRRVRAALARGQATARIAAYRKLIVVQWSLVLFLVAHWLMIERPFMALRIAVPLTREHLGGLVVTAAVTLILLRQLQSVRASAETAQQAREQLRDLSPILPHDAREFAWFRLVSITAGTCEEVLYRGFLPWLLALMMPVPAAFVVAALIFGVGHAYQGVSGVVKTSVVGLVMGGMTWATGTVIPAILLHVAIDWLNGRLAYEVLTSEEDPPPPL